MKITKYFLLLLSIALLIPACESKLNLEGKAPGVVYFAKSGYNKLISYEVGEAYTADIWIGKGGLTSGNTTVEFIVTQSILDSVNLVDGTNYQLLPSECYSIKSSTVEIPSDSSVMKGAITYYPDKIAKLAGFDMEKYALPLKLSSKSGFSINPEKDEMLLTFVVSDPTVKILNPGFNEIDITDENIKSLDVNIGVEFTNKWDIKVALAHNQSIVDAYNTANNSYYVLMPATMYEGPAQVDIKQGVKSAIASFTLLKNKLMPGNYILPIQIASLQSSLNGTPTDVIKFDGASSTMFAFSKMGTKIPKKGWTIESFTTEEPAEGQWGNGGKAIHLIDDDVKTFWHARWSGGDDPLPYQITIDMHANYLVSQIEIITRGPDSNNPIKVLSFETSKDGVNWTFVGKFPHQNIATPLLFAVKSTEARYIRMTLPDGENTSRIAALRELSAYGQAIN
ncbi:MAG: DUF1735 domain-containing protein [Bacteroidia bacterium]|nr:DUF1735 domain-containing protein [Bacteroidia bacterium]